MGDENNLLGTLGQATPPNEANDEENLLGDLGKASYDNNNVEYVYNENNLPPNNEEPPPPTPKPKSIATAIDEGDFEGVRAFLKSMEKSNLQKAKETQGLVNKATAKAVEPGLNAPTAQRRLDILRILLDAKFNPDEINPSNPRMRPLNLVARASGNIRNIIPTYLIATLVQEGAKVDGIGTSIPPIFDAIQSQNQVALEELHSYGANVNKEWSHMTPLYMAITNKWVTGVRMLLTMGASLSSIDLIGDNIFILAVKLNEDAEKRKNAILQLLLKGNVRADFKNKANKTALMIAAQNGDLETLTTLLNDSRFVATINLDTGKGTPLALIFQRLFDTPKPSAEEIRVLQAAAELLLKKGAMLHDLQIQKGELSYPLFHAAVDAGDVAMADLVLKIQKAKGLSPINTAGGPYGFTPLGYATAKDNVEMIRFLLERGADPNGSAEGESTPLVTAVIHGAHDAFETLLEGGATLSADMVHLLIESTPDESISRFNQFLTAILERGLDLNAKNDESMTPLMIAAKKGKAEIAKTLLERGVDPTVTKIDGNPLTPTAYDMAKDMAVRLVIAPYLETDEPRFRGYLKDDFERFNLVFDDLVNFVLCPFCFIPLAHAGGCMYIFEHSCLREKEQQRQAGYRTLPIIHDKLYQTYKDEKQNITVCHHCNRAGYTWPEGMLQGQELVGHAHIELNTADPFVTPRQAKKAYGANYWDQTGCIPQGGGSHNEKLLRIQVLLNFMCFMNQHFVGKISNLRSQLMAREMFWDAPLYNGQYLTSRYFSHEIADTKIGDMFPEFRDASVKTLIELIRANKRFFKVCDHPTELLPLPKGIVNVAEKEKVYANIPRYGTNATDLAPEIVGQDGVGGKHCYYPSINLDDPHNDGRNLWGFKHRQPGTKTVYDHEEHDRLICGPCLEVFLRINIIDIKNADKQIICFAEDCYGHFHPSEVQGIVSDEVYQAYKAYYNRFAPVLGGGRRNEETDYPPLIGHPATVEQDSCPVRFKGGKKTTRRVRKTKKTRKARRLRKTRRTN